VLVEADVPWFEISIIDIHRQKKLERALRQDRSRLASLIESLSAGLFLVNRGGQLTDFNSELCNLLQLDPVRIAGEDARNLIGHLISKAQNPDVLQVDLDQALAAITERPVLIIPLKGAHAPQLELALFPVWQDDGDVLGWGGLIRDVTEERSRLAWKLELLSMMAHDIRVPLATLKGHATALLANYRQWGDAMVSEFLSTIDSTIDRLVHQVDRSLSLTRVEAGRLGLRPQPVEVKDLFDQALERAAGILERQQVRVQIEAPVQRVRVDPARIEEVLVNLLENAVRFAPAGSPMTLKAWEESGRMHLAVIDQGPGIRAEDQERIFHKHVRGGDQEGGSGLGLYISRKLVQAHGGSIHAISPPPGEERGTQFEFTLPLMPPARQTGRKAQAKPPAAGDGQRLLVVEDESDFQTLFQTILEGAGFEVLLASHAQAALDQIHLDTPDLIIMDWMLPGMDGVNACRNIRRWTGTPILLVTARTGLEDLIAGLDAGADDYLTKPFQSSELLARVRALLRRKEGMLEDQADQFQAEGILIDFDAQQIWVRGKPVRLTPTEFDLLSYLARHRGQVLTYYQLGEHIWAQDQDWTRHDLFVHISRLRQKIERQPKSPSFIVTRWGVGYVFLPRHAG
jgi:DNA-binding response OmpR family regulator/signal transduction histidine kinase